MGDSASFFAKPGALALADSPSEAPLYVFALSNDKFDVNEGDFWEIQVQAAQRTTPHPCRRLVLPTHAPNDEACRRRSRGHRWRPVDSGCGEP
jgi:hypothetical protein